jgi:hypothetical protein
MLFKTKIIIAILFFSNGAFAQESINVRPKSFDNETLRQEISTKIMPPLDIDQLLLEDSQPGIRPFRYGYKFDTYFTPSNSGTWDILPNGDKIWRLRIRSADAYAIRLFFTDFDLPEGAFLHLYGSEEVEYFGGYTSENNEPFFSTPLVNGDICVIEYFQPVSAINEPNLQVSSVIHDYKDFYNILSGDRDACGTNVVCPEADPYGDQINASAHLDMGWSICSGAMINNTAQDLIPYFLTADHCVSGEQPSGFRFYFNYATSTCSGSTANQGSSAYGSELKWRSYGFSGGDINTGNDVALLEITANIPDSWDVFYAGWNIDTSPSQDASVGVHHPGGEPKQINFSTGVATTSNFNSTNFGTHWEVNWCNEFNSNDPDCTGITYGGATEGGSSGSPLFDDNGRILGPLSGGPDVSCGDINDDAVYGKLNYNCPDWCTHHDDSGHISWSDLQPFLDPENTGATYLGGIYEIFVVVPGCTDPDAENYNLDANQDDGSCEYFSAGDALISFGNVSGNIVEIVLNNSTPITGFQFLVTDTPDLYSLITTDGGSATTYGLTISPSSTGLVLGFSFVAATIPAGTSVLTNLSFEGSGVASLCLSEGIISDENAQPLDVSYGDCITFSGGIAGDVNVDSVVNVLDVVLMVNFVLGNVEPSASEFAGADLNSDGTINVLDVVSVVNIILDN